MHLGQEKSSQDILEVELHCSYIVILVITPYFLCKMKDWSSKVTPDAYCQG